MEEIKAPGIFLSFDDWYIQEWHGALPFFEMNNIKAIFNVSFMFETKEKIYDGDFQQLREIQEEGHTIGFHSTTHESASTYINKMGTEQYLEKEIFPGLEKLNKAGFYPRHFAYPYGQYNEASNICLGKIFDTLRVTFEALAGRDMTEHTLSHTYADLNAIKEAGFLKAYCIDTDISLIKQVLAYERIVFIYGHIPDFEKLTELVMAAKKSQAKFYSMELLNK